MRVSSAAVVLPVSDWSAVLPWYRDVLGCRVVHVDESLGQVVHLQFGRRQHFALWLDWGDPVFPRADPRQVRTACLALCVRSVAEARKALRARGAECSRTPTGLLMLRDPDGNEIVLLARARTRDARRAQRRAAELAASPAKEAGRWTWLPPESD